LRVPLEIKFAPGFLIRLGHSHDEAGLIFTACLQGNRTNQKAEKS